MHSSARGTEMINNQGIKTTEFGSVLLAYAAIFTNAYLGLGISEGLLLSIVGMSTAYTLGRQTVKKAAVSSEEKKPV